MFALEQNHHYDPSKPAILDGRPTGGQLNSPGQNKGSAEAVRKENVNPATQTASPTIEELESFEMVYTTHDAVTLSPSKANTSPAKSSLSRKPANVERNNGFDPETGIWEDDDDSEKKLPEGKSLHRHAKSVTFDQAPPQVNEYEMTTPDPSSVASGSREGSYESTVDDDEEVHFERGSFIDHDDSFDASLEDTDKTPVVLPEDWRFMSPENANTHLAQHEEDVFDDEYGSPAPNAHPGTLEYRAHQTSVNSVDSNGQPRPLPPLPPTSTSRMGSPRATDGFSGTLERISSGQRSLPSPPLPAASISKSDIRRMSGSGLSLEDRLRLMMLSEQEQDKKIEADKQRERRMRRAETKEVSPVREASQESTKEESGKPGPDVVEDYSDAPRISRESILRHMRSTQDMPEAGNQPTGHGIFAHNIDPDVPIPSLEDPTQIRAEPIVVKEEEEEENDLYSIPDLYSRGADTESETDGDDDIASQYSQPSMAALPINPSDEGQDTPRALTPAHGVEKKSLFQDRMSLPDFMDFGNEPSFDLGLERYMTPPTESNNTPKADNVSPTKSALPNLAALRDSIKHPLAVTERFEPLGPPRELEPVGDEPGTPDSVIRHPLGNSESPEIDAAEATVKVPGGKLKIRPSLTLSESDDLKSEMRETGSRIIPETLEPQPPEQKPAEDLESTKLMPQAASLAPAAEITKKRVSSLVQLEIPRDQSDESLGFGLEKEFDRVVEDQKVAFELSLQRLYYPFHGRFPPAEYPISKDLEIANPMRNIPLLPKPRGARALPGADIVDICPLRFESPIADRSPGRQRGYLMRQNTKIVVASNRVSQEEPRVPGIAPQGPDVQSIEANQVQPSPRKISQPTWTAEPWNGKSRRKSIRVGGETTSPKRKAVEGAVPPLPGQISNAQGALGAVVEDELAEEEAEELEEGTERGRLFVKVVGAKDLQLPFPQRKAIPVQI